MATCTKRSRPTPCPGAGGAVSRCGSACWRRWACFSSPRPSEHVAFLTHAHNGIASLAGMRVDTQRKQPRVDYASPVNLHWTGRTQPLSARSLNLGPSGVLVEADEGCDVGTEVACDIHLPGGLRRLRGRVVRLESLPAGVALG